MKKSLELTPLSLVLNKKDISATLNVGDIIRDTEDDECYYEGIIVRLNPLRYKVTSIVWNGETDTSLNGEISDFKWMLLYVFKNGVYIKIN